MQSQQILNLGFHGIGRPIGRDFGRGERDYWIGREVLLGALDACVGRTDVSLSFDDGNFSDADVVLPALLERGLTATFFIVPSWLGETGFMSRRDLRELAQAGMAFGNHGLAHHEWTALAPDKLEYEVSQGRRLIEELTGTEVDTLAIPYGSYDDRVLETLRRQAYERVYTTDGGLADAEAWLQPRELVTAAHDEQAVRALIERRA